MSLHYIIDGYNVIKQVKFLTGKRLRTGREGLVWFIEKYRPQGSNRNEVTLVFDGKADITSPKMKTDIQVIFSRNEPADDKIKHLVEGSSNPKRIVVVSDDRQIMFYCRSIGARVQSVKEFLDNASLTSKKSNKLKKIDKTDQCKPGLDNNVAAAITEQLKNIWLKEKD